MHSGSISDADLTFYGLTINPYGASGYVRILLFACEKDARTRRCRALRLEVRVDNRRANALYEENGYSVFDTVEVYYEDGARALRFEKNLRRN